MATMDLVGRLPLATVGVLRENLNDLACINCNIVTYKFISIIKFWPRRLACAMGKFYFFKKKR